MSRVLLLLWLLLLPAAAQPATDLQLDAWFSTGDKVHPDRFLPITVQIQNQGPERSLSLELRLGQMSVIDPVTVKVPAGARQQFQLGVPHFEGWHNEMQLVARQAGSVRAQTTIKFETMSEGLAVAVLVPPGQSAFNYLQGYNDVLGVTNGTSPPIRLSSPRPEGLPTHWSGYLAVDLVIVHDLTRLDLTSPQVQALADWARAGGTLALVSSGDPSEYRGTPLEALLPLVPEGSRDEESFPLVVGSLRDGARVMKSRGGSPTLVGQGEVFWFTFPILKDTVLGSEATRAYWAPVLKTAFAHVSQTDGFGLRAEGLLRSLSEMMLPSPGLLAWLLLGYVLLVGPINFAILKKRDRMLWIFVTVPVMAVLFTLGMFLTTQLSHGTVSITREISRLRVVSGASQGVMDSQLTLFWPFPGQARVRCSRPTAALIEPVRGNAEDQPAVLLSDVMTYPSVAMQMSSLRRFSARSVTELPAPIRVAIARRQGNGLVLEVDNRSGVSLESCCLVEGNRFSQKFRLEPGRQETHLELGASDASSLAHSLLGHPGEDGRAKDRVELMTRELNRAQGGGGAVLLGWSSELGAGMEFSGSPRRIRDCLVVVESP